MEGMAFARNVFGGDSEAKPDYDNIASAVFGGPPMCYVGYTEEEATEKLGDVDIYSSSFKYAQTIAIYNMIKHSKIKQSSLLSCNSDYSIRTAKTNAASKTVAL